MKNRSNYLMKATTPSNVSALTASFLVANHIAKARKHFAVDEELILPAAKDICCELLGEAAVQKVTHIPLSAITITRQTDEIAEDTEAQLLERINTSPIVKAFLALAMRLATKTDGALRADTLDEVVAFNIASVLRVHVFVFSFEKLQRLVF